MRREHRPWPQPSVPRFPAGEDDRRSGRLIPVEDVSPRMRVVWTHWTGVVANEVEERCKSVMTDDCSAPDRSPPQDQPQQGEERGCGQAPDVNREESGVHCLSLVVKGPLPRVVALASLDSLVSRLVGRAFRSTEFDRPVMVGGVAGRNAGSRRRPRLSVVSAPCVACGGNAQPQNANGEGNGFQAGTAMSTLEMGR